MSNTSRITPELQTKHINLADVTVIVVTYDSAHCIPLLVDLISACPNAVIVDNGSSDNTLQLAAALLPRAKLIALGCNLGFGAANNKALNQTTTRFAFLLNPDCEISPRSLLKLVEESVHYPRAAILAPQLIDRHGEPELNYRWPANRWKSMGPVATGPACVGFVSGAAMLLNLENMSEADRFDEKFFLYYEDDDLCLRNFNRSREILVIPSVTARHRSRDSVRGRSPLKADYLRGFHHAQSKLRFAQIHTSNECARSLRLRLLLVASLAWPLRLLIFSPRMVARWAGRIVGLATWSPHE